MDELTKLKNKIKNHKKSFNCFHRRMRSKKTLPIRDQLLIRATNRMYYENMEEMEKKLKILNNLGSGI